MPILDVTFIALDPMTADSFSVTRRTETIDTHGRKVTSNVVTPDVPGTVTMDNPSDLMRTPDAASVPRTILVCCAFHLTGVATNKQPDIVTWRGTDYTVIRSYPYVGFGSGLFESVCISSNATDASL